MKPRIIIHGGAGNITRQNLSNDSYQTYRSALLAILREVHKVLRIPNATALDAATHAVTLLENNHLFNAGHGAVFTKTGTHELEASVMCSQGYRKRGVGVMKVRRAKNPILLAKEMLLRGEEDDGGGAQGHCQLAGDTCDALAREWGLESVKPSYYWTRKRWDEHRRGLGLDHDDHTYKAHKREADEGVQDEQQTAFEDSYIDDDFYAGDVSWDGKEYLPQGTVGAVALDSTGTTCVATSTGGITNKLPGRIGDTPTLGAGFWAEEWETACFQHSPIQHSSPPLGSVASLLTDCLPALSRYLPLPSGESECYDTDQGKFVHKKRAVAISGTGNGDSFLRLAAVRTAAAIAQYSRAIPLTSGTHPLQAAVTAIAGPNGKLQLSAEDRWHKTGEGEGGMIGIDYQEGKGGQVVADFNCGGMFRAWLDDEGAERMAVFREEV